MDKNEYLVARVGHINLGAYCRDIENVYSDTIRLFRLFDQGGFFLGLTVLNNQVMQVLDLRRRIGMSQREKSDQMTVISFNTGAKNRLAVVVDEIVGMKQITEDYIQKNSKLLANNKNNIDLLFPFIAIIPKTEASSTISSTLANGGCELNTNSELIHLLDATYLEKHQPIIEDAGELELF